MTAPPRPTGTLGRTIVLVAHDIDFASCHSDRIVAMREGVVIADAPPDQLMVSPTLRRVFDVDVHDVSGDRIGVYYRCDL